VHRLRRQIVVDELFAVAFQCSVAEFVDAGFEIERELNVAVKEVGIDPGAPGLVQSKVSWRNSNPAME
jgi:hypothetical protein